MAGLALVFPIAGLAMARPAAALAAPRRGIGRWRQRNHQRRRRLAGTGNAQQAAAAPDNADAITKLASAEGRLGASLGRFMAVAESYPDLKANHTIQQLMEELTSTENKIAFARQHYND